MKFPANNVKNILRKGAKAQRNPEKAKLSLCAFAPLREFSFHWPFAPSRLCVESSAALTFAMVILQLSFCNFLHAQPSIIPPGYSVETIPTPPGVDFEVGGIGFLPDSSLLVTTRHGDVWRRHESTGEWSLYAEGLHEPLGIWVDPRNGDAYIAQRAELTRLVDEDKDGDADLYQTVCADWGFSGNYHEYAFGPVRDSAGNFYVTLNLSHSTERVVGETEMGNSAPFRGWCVRISPDGKMTPIASGMRSPAGIGISRDDELFYTDNQGGYNATSGLYHILPGRFFGHPNSLYDDPRFAGRDLASIPLENLDALRTLPAIWIPHGELANSPGEPVFDNTSGKFGPFAGQLFVGDQTKSNLMRIALEKVGGEYQGAIFNFIDPLDSGVIRNAFAPDGSLYVGMTARGWGSIGAKPFSLQRIIYDGKTIPFEMHTVSLTRTGFDITFTKPADPATAAGTERYLVRHWGYKYQPAYGSPKVDETFVLPQAVTLSVDGKTVHLDLPLVPRRVYQLLLVNITSTAGEKLTTPTAYYTLNRLRE